MAVYMRDQFPFLGVASPDRRRAVAATLAGSAPPAAGDIEAVVRRCHRELEREYHDAAVAAARARVRVPGVVYLDREATKHL